MDFCSDPAREEGDVVVTLQGQDSGPLSQRQIKLTPQKPTAAVGRASKVPTKGFVAGKDNAWFDSPVMSRQHAELIANFDDKSVSVKDIKSLHGTFHKTTGGKEDRLPVKEALKLVNGDRLRFGIDIYRQHETFPPCTVDVTVQWSEPIAQAKLSPPTKTFAVPDSDSDNSDSESVIIDHRSNHVLTDSIDLTHESPSPRHRAAMASNVAAGRNKSSSDVIDLTSEMDYDSDVDNQDHESLPDYNQDQQAVQVLPNVRDAELSLCDAEHDNKMVQMSPARTHLNLESDSQSNSDISENNCTCSSENGVDNDAQEEGEGSVMGFLLPESSVAQPAHQPISRIVWDDSDEARSDASSYDSDDMSDPDLLVMRDGDDFSDVSDDSAEGRSDESESLNDMEDGDSSMADDPNAPSDDFDEDDESTYNFQPYLEGDLSSDSEDDLEHSMFDKQSSPVDSTSSSPVAQPDKAHPFGFPASGTRTLTLVSNTAVYSNHSVNSPNYTPAPAACQPESQRRYHNCMTSALATFSAAPLSNFSPMNGTATLSNIFNDAKTRQPSPSDAALVKALPTPAAPVMSIAQVLGAKTGKPEYFAAREGNRAVAMACPLLPVKAVSVIRETLMTNIPKSGKPLSEGPRQTMSGPFKPADKALWTEPTPAQSLPLPQLNNDTNTPESNTATDEYSASMTSPNAPPNASRTASPPPKSALEVSGATFINSPPTLPKRTRLQSPDLDMSSAFAYQQSKQASGDKAASTRRLPLGIPDLIESKAIPSAVEVAPVVKPEFSFQPRPYSKPVLLKHSILAKHAVPSIKPASPMPAPAVKITRPSKRSFEVFVEGMSSEPTTVVAKPATQQPSYPTDTERGQATEIQDSPPNNERPAKRRFVGFSSYLGVAVLSGAAVFSALVSNSPQLI